LTWLLRLLNTAFDIYVFLIIARSVASWFPIPRLHSIYQFLYDMTEPILAPFRRVNQLIGYRLPVDLSPWLAIIALQLARSLLFNILRARLF
jgi:YggT family protein